MEVRPSLPASSSDFALHASSSGSSSTSTSSEDFNPLLMRFRRPSLLAPPRATFYSEGRLNSPLASASFTLPIARRNTAASTSGEESESDKEKMWTDSPPSGNSGANTPSTPSLAPPISFTHKEDKSSASIDSDTSMKSSSQSDSSSSNEVKTAKVRAKRSRSASPSRASTSTTSDSVLETPPPVKPRRISHSMKLPRIMSLLAESHPEENEVKSEAQFQRFVASFSELPRTPRALLDRGRYPEEAAVDEPVREDTPSDDEDEVDTNFMPFSYAYTGGSEPIAIAKPGSVYGGDDHGLSESPGTSAMDVDMPSSACGSPRLSTSASSWRYTPPPTSTSAVRSNKRKLDDRYDPYPSSKRRAVSPSVSYLRESQPSLFTPRTPGRHPTVLPIAIPVLPSSGASSPVMTPSSLNGGRPMSMNMSWVPQSPTLRAHQIGLASPVLRPMMRRRDEREGKEVEGTGEGVSGIRLDGG